jgi:hypothetical protein
MSDLLNKDKNHAYRIKGQKETKSTLVVIWIETLSEMQSPSSDLGLEKGH